MPGAAEIFNRSKVGVGAGAIEKIPESKHMEPELPELDHFPGIGAEAGVVETSNSELEPKPGPE